VVRRSTPEGLSAPRPRAPFRRTPTPGPRRAPPDPRGCPRARRRWRAPPTPGGFRGRAARPKRIRCRLRTNAVDGRRRGTRPRPQGTEGDRGPRPAAPLPPSGLPAGLRATRDVQAAAAVTYAAVLKAPASGLWRRAADPRVAGILQSGPRTPPV
jgi:hypothetical protein